MEETTLDVLFGYLIMNIRNYEVVSTIAEYLQGSAQGGSTPSVDMTGFINLYTQ